MSNLFYRFSGIRNYENYGISIELICKYNIDKLL